jgi:hypothetical protein
MKKNFAGYIRNFKNELVLAFWQGEILCAEVHSDWYSVLGKIKRKNDGRWEFSIKIPSIEYYQIINQVKKEIKQGVFLTKDEAVEHLEKVWGISK